MAALLETAALVENVNSTFAVVADELVQGSCWAPAVVCPLKCCLPCEWSVCGGGAGHQLLSAL
eukprot:364861-Chlamydomonas_euryale.AAC.19